MLTIPLYRAPSEPNQTLGQIISKELNFHCNTLELPWKNNQSNVSCIPANKYLVKWTRSNRISKMHLDRWLKKNPGKTEKDCPDAEKNVFTYEIFGVPGRAGIRIHSANYFHELKGCIAFGSDLKDLDMDTNLDLVHSGATVAMFARIMDYQDFYIDIKDAA